MAERVVKKIKKVVKAGPPSSVEIHGTTVVLNELIAQAQTIYCIRMNKSQADVDKAIKMWMRQKLDQLTLFRCAYYRYAHNIVPDSVYDIREKELWLMVQHYPEHYQTAMKARSDAYNPLKEPRPDVINTVGGSSIMYTDRTEEVAADFAKRGVTLDTGWTGSKKPVTKKIRRVVKQ